MTWLSSLGALLGSLLFIGVALSAYGSRRWDGLVRTSTRRIEAARTDDRTGASSGRRYHEQELEGLPLPVQRYFRAVLTHGQPIVAAATIEFSGSFNPALVNGQWKPFTSRQRVITHRPAFLWDARMKMLPGLTVRVIDSYVGGEGQLRAALLGLFTVADAQGGGELARGEFMRFVAEAAWYPTALLPSQGVRWDAVDECSARATIADGAVTLSLLFTFGDRGPIDSVYAEARGAMIGQDIVMTPWEGRWADYRVQDGMTVPFEAEVAWLRPEGRRPYFRGTVTSLRYEFSA